eukprot:CAMPEP_0204516604 /NCGR_PEP_ID=MMETSP0661-20131031/3232_1 /ASSEMBLY_ACC=CAM_ASM_000606 /TAXON_ID=109239 /ORGANISM="Alexandrium margalefi, Strain AMGDE01CS-322" /LENGTH=450 /DNA_ID=CAMNT_0051521969 /DNA_START=9 /DNA_END=1361 /DNA_ORIENTATION=-
MIAAASNLSTAYNLVNINLAHVEMENQYCHGDECRAAVTTVSTACLVGAIAGQLTFGYVGDCLGRAKALNLTMVLSVLGALASAFAVPLDSSNPSSVFVFVSIARFVLGVGVGGVYPLSATIAAESSSAASRGRSVSLVFSMQGVGQLLVPVVGLVFLYSFGTANARSDDNRGLVGVSWRLILGVGALPGLILMPLKMTSGGPGASSPASSPRQSQLTLRQALQRRANWPKLIGCAGGWFLFDITFYGNTLFSPTVLKSVFHEGSEATPTIGPTLSGNLCLQLMILALIGLPGYYVSVYFMDKVGRKKIQLQGFLFMALLYFGLGLFLEKMKDDPMILLLVYGLTYFFSNFGPNSTTFILPSETFPFEVRSSLNGLCAAMGKVGAVVGSSGFKPLVHAAGTSIAFYVCAACALVGAVVTVLCVEDRRNRDIAETSFVEANRREAEMGTGL